MPKNDIEGLRETSGVPPVAKEKVLFIFDEPTSGLDVISSRAVLDFVKQCKDDGRTILYSSHSMYETEEICDKIAVIHDGKILMTDSIEHIRKEHGSLEKAFIATVKGERS